MIDGRLARRSETREQLHRSAVRRSVIRVCLLRARRGEALDLHGEVIIARLESLLRFSRLAPRIPRSRTGRRDTSISRDSPFLPFLPCLLLALPRLCILTRFAIRRALAGALCASRLLLDSRSFRFAMQSERGDVYKKFPQAYVKIQRCQEKFNRPESVY